MRFILPCLALLLLTAGCIDVEQEYTLNPDGSGKVVVRWLGSPFDIGDKSAEARAKSLLKDEVTKSEGVDAWKDVSCVARDDGKFEFKGTAYFKDFAQLKLNNAGFKMISLKATKDAAGNLVLVNEPAKGDAPPKALSDEEAKWKLKDERAQYKQSKPLIDGALSELKASTKINLPGRVGAVTNFKKAGESSVRLSLEGKTVGKALDDLIMNDEWMLKLLKSHGGLQGDVPSDDTLNERIFGEKGPVRAVTTGDLKPLFDYEAEASAARKAWEEFAARIGAGPVGPAAKGGDFKSLKVSGVRFVHEQDSERGLGHESPGMTVSFIGDLPGRVLKVKQGLLKKAVADTGESVLPSDDFSRTIHFVHLSNDKAGVSFDVKLKMPPAPSKGLKEVSGVLTYLVGGKTKETDLGFDELKAGAEGKGAKITKIEEVTGSGEPQQTLEVQIEMSGDLVESVVVKDSSGAELKTSDGGSWSSGNETSKSLTIKGKFPAKGRIVARVYDDLKEYEIPFKIENVDLLGRPIK